VARRVLTATLVLLAVLGSAGSLLAQGYDPAKTPVVKVPAPSTGALVPTAILGDGSGWNFGSTPGKDQRYWHDVDVENGWIFTATGRGLQVFDARTTPESPEAKTYFFASTSTVPDWHQNDTKFYLFGVDAPSGYDGVVAVASISGNGMLIFDTRNKSITPQLVYQDESKEGSQVWATSYGGSYYAFYAATSDRVLVYNMSAALNITNPNNAHGCLDESPNSLPCRDSQGHQVYVGKVNTQYGVSYLHGAGDYLAVSEGIQVELWRVSSPASPQQVLKFSPPGQSKGVAMWQVGSNYYLAVLQATGSAPRILRIYDVSCVTSGCAGAPPVVGTYNMNHPEAAEMLYVTVSQAGGSTFLYVGGDNQFSGGAQREYLVDASNPVSPVELTPPFAPTGYWGWYYYGNPTGYNWVMPRTAKLATAANGKTYLYRAAFGLFDVHELKGSTPTAGFTYSTPDAADGKVYRGEHVNFNDSSSHNPTSWSWTFPDGSPGASSAQSPQQVVFTTTGTKTVSLQINGNTDPLKAATVPIEVIEPVPAIGNISIVPTSPQVCQHVSFAGVNVTGKPALGYLWEVLDGSDTPLPGVSGTQATFNWDTSTSTAGSYKIRLTVSNATSTAKVVPFTLTTPDPLPDPATTPTFKPTVTPDPPTGGTVSLSLAAGVAAGAAEWQWDFGDGTVTAWTSDPQLGPNPLPHKYTAIGTYQARVSVRNCVDLAGKTSNPTPVVITKLIDLKAQFSVICGVSCSFIDVGQSLTFEDASTGGAFWDYDWDGNGSFEDPDHPAPVTSHAYSATGTFHPQLRVKTAKDTTAEISPTFTLPDALIVNGTVQPPSISVGGSGSATVGTSITLTGSASHCTASPTGWTWDTAGGTITGSSNTSAISVSWATAGNKLVKASNSGCSGAQGTKTVVVSGGGGGGGGGGSLKANFTYSVPVVQNQQATFNGSSSTGNPTSYVWDFGDGTGTVSGAQATHTFAQAGTFTVKLTVTAPGSCPPAPFCDNSTQQGVVVLSGAVLLSASFNSEICHAELNFVLCNADAGQEVTFTDASTGTIVSRTWDFGDGDTATGTVVKHTYKKAGTWPLTLTVSDGTTTNSFSRQIIVSGGGPLTEAMVLPWIAKTVEGALVQSSDLYLHNPGTEPIDVTLEFRQRGLPEANPPKATRTIAPNATLFASDVVKSLFGRENVTGFVGVTIDRGGIQPVVMSFNTTFQDNGSEFGQTVPGYLLSNTGAASSTGNNQVQHLVGLNDNSDRFAYFGLSNPGGNPVTYRLRFFDSLGHEIGTGSQPVTLSRYGIKQYQVKDVRSLFGVSDKDDYRVMIESAQGTPLFPYGANLRIASDDPSFVAVGSGAARVFLLGALSTPGANNSIWQSDVVIANTSDQVVIADLTFTNVGLTSTSTDTIHETLQPGETRRLEDVIGTKWNIRNGVGVLAIDSNAPGGKFPLIQGESYENTNPAKRYGQTLPALTAEQAAGAGQGQYLVGLRQDTKYRTTFWVFNPGSQADQYDVIFRAFDGHELGRITNVTMGPGKLRQFNQAQFPPGLASGFTVQVLVKSGKVLSGAQVVNNATNDPAYIQGETR